MEKYKFTSVVAQDLLDSFLSFFPELKEQSVDCRAGESHCLPCVRGHPQPTRGTEGVKVWGGLYCTGYCFCLGKGPLGSAVPPSANPGQMA